MNIYNIQCKFYNYYVKIFVNLTNLLIIQYFLIFSQINKYIYKILINLHKEIRINNHANNPIILIDVLSQF